MSSAPASGPKGVALICEEPFRLFFPVGIIVSILGVGLWPMLYAEMLSFPPHVPHARVAVVMIFAGLLATGLFPVFQKGFDHLMFIGGFGLVVLTVASRVVLGHAERLDLATGRSRPMRWVVWMLLVAAATRATADPLPHIAVSHHIYAAILWWVSAIVWGWWVFPRLREIKR